MSSNRKGNKSNKADSAQLGPKDGCPTGTLKIACTSGPTYTLLLTGSTPEELRAAVLRVAKECEEINRREQTEVVERAEKKWGN